MYIPTKFHVFICFGFLVKKKMKMNKTPYHSPMHLGTMPIPISTTVKPEILAAIIFSVLLRLHILAAINISVLLLVVNFDLL